MEWCFLCPVCVCRRAIQAEWARRDFALSQAFEDSQNDRAAQKVFGPHDHAGQSFDVISKQARRAVLVKNAPVVGETGCQLNIMADALFQRGERFARISDRPGKHGQRLGVNVLALDCLSEKRFCSIV